MTQMRKAERLYNDTAALRPMRLIVLGSEDPLESEFLPMVEKTGRFRILQRTAGYPDGDDLEKLVRLYAPEVIMLSFEAPHKAFELAERIRTVAPTLPIVAMGASFAPDHLIQMIRSGVREVAKLPLTDSDVSDFALKCTELVKASPSSQSDEGTVLSFLPAKPGVGASTIAANTALHLAPQMKSEALLIDFDLQAGLLAFMLKLRSGHSLADLIHRADDLDEVIFKKTVARREGLDVLASGRLGLGASLTIGHTQLVLDFAKRFYRTICADLSGALEPYSVEILKSSKTIYLVTTPEIFALHLARERYSMLSGLGFAEQTSLIVNRWHKGSLMSLQEIEKTVSAPVAATLPNDYKALHYAFLAGKSPREGTPFARAIEQLSLSIVGGSSEGEADSPGETSQLENLRGKLRRGLRSARTVVVPG